MQFTYSGTNQKLSDAAAFANNLPEGFWDAVASEGSYTNTSLTPEQIRDKLKACEDTVEVRDWTPETHEADDYEDTIAVVRPSLKNVILYHSKFIGRTTAQKVNTLVHEFVHVVDCFHDDDDDWNYTHSGQSPDGNEQSAPYRIGDIAEAYYEQAHDHECENKEELMGMLLSRNFAKEARFNCATSVIE